VARATGSVFDPSEAVESARQERARLHDVELAGLAHDLNNLLTALSGSLSLARLAPADSPDREALLDIGVRAAHQAHELVQCLLALTLGAPPPPVQTTALAPLVHDAVTLFLRGAAITCECSIPDDLWPVGLSAGELGQIINNLVLNAREATPPGGRITLSAANVRVHRGAADEGRRVPLPDGLYVALVIRDTGRGIRRADLARIFEPAFSTKPGGHGLGLATVRAIVLRHGGHIQVSSRPGHGTIFRVYLPALCAGRKAPEDANSATQLLGQGRILVVEDDRGLRELAWQMLGHLGYEVETAATLAEAVELLAAGCKAGRGFAAVILDLAVPGSVCAEETVARLRERDLQVPIILSTGDVTHPAVVSPARYGYAAVLSKPYRLADLARVVAHVIAGSSQGNASAPARR